MPVWICGWIYRIANWTTYLLVIIAGGVLAWSGPASAVALERLEIDVMGFAGDGSLSVPLIWGLVRDETFFVGGDRVQREHAEVIAAAATKVEATVKQPSEGPRPPTLATTFELRLQEMQACVQTKRFRMLLELIRSLHDRVEDIIWQGPEQSRDCRAKVEAELAKLGLRLSGDTGLVPSSGDHVVLAIHFATAATMQKQEVAAQSEQDARLSAEQTRLAAAATAPKPAPRELRIAGQLIPITPAGWFIYQAPSFSAVEVELTQSGFKPWHKTVQPWPVKIGDSAAPASIGLSRILVTGGKPSVQIRSVALPPSSQDVVLDLATGGGFGYGHHLPHETRGSRFAVAAAIAKKSLDDDLNVGARAAVSATYSASSAVSSTLLMDVVLTRSADSRAGSWRGQLGLGTRYFQSTQKTLKSAKPLLIPQSVLGPLLSVGAHGQEGDVLLGGGVAYVPLYVAGAGLTQTLSPNFEGGLATGQGGAILLSWAEDSIKYPTLSGHAALTLDTFYLSFRLGF